MTCNDCKNAELHGFPPEGTPDWVVFTVSLWCPLKETHGMGTCELFEIGKPRIVRDDMDGGL